MTSAGGVLYLLRASRSAARMRCGVAGISGYGVTGYAGYGDTSPISLIPISSCPPGATIRRFGPGLREMIEGEVAVFKNTHWRRLRRPVT